MSKAKRYLGKDIVVTKRKVVMEKMIRPYKNNQKQCKAQKQRKAEVQKGKTLLNKGDQ